MIGTLAVKNWAKFQHYKHRCPPWIKLAADTFQNPEFSCLQDASKLLAVCIWTLASRTQEGIVPDNFDYIKQWGFLGKEVKKEHLTELIESGFLVRNTDALASCKQNASTLHTNADSETEKRQSREEAETETTAKNEKPKPPVIRKPMTAEEAKRQLKEFAAKRAMQ